MSVFQNTLLVVNILVALVIIALVLLQHGKGADTGASFGSGASGSIFGASGSANFLSRSTSVMITLFFIVSVSLSYISLHNKESGSSVVERILTNPSLSGNANSPANPSAGVVVPSAMIPSDTINQIPR